MTVGGNVLTVHAGQAIAVACTSGDGSLDVQFGSVGGWFAPDFRHLSVRMTHVTVAASGPRQGSAHACVLVR